MKYDHVIWDWNGTLLDDLWLCIDSINFVLESRNMPKVEEDSYKDIFTFPVINYYEYLGFDFSKEKFPIPDFLDYYKSHFKKCNLHEGVRSVLKKNKDSGISQSILSAGKQSSLINWVKYHEIDHYFNALIGINNNNAEGKTTAGLKWLSKIGIKEEKILLIGDTVHDSEVAEAMGIDCILVDIGHVSKSRLIKTGRNVYSSINSLIDYIQK